MGDGRLLLPMETEVVAKKEMQMKRMFLRGAVGALLTLGVASMASAQVLVQLPDSSQTTTLTANVSSQATVTTPANVTFNVPFKRACPVKTFSWS